MPMMSGKIQPDSYISPDEDFGFCQSEGAWRTRQVSRVGSEPTLIQEKVGLQGK